jgi:RNA polymerase sigma-70 factor (ECF subfamily)
MGERREAEEDVDALWESLERRFRAPLSAYFTRRVGGREEADELTQEVFIRLIRNPGLGSDETPERHVFKMASGVLQDWSRYRTSRVSEGAGMLGDVSETLEIAPVSVDERGRALSQAAREALRDLEDALSGLARRTREIFLLSRVENVPPHEIAELYGISDSAVKKHVLKAMVHLSARDFKS